MQTLSFFTGIRIVVVPFGVTPVVSMRIRLRNDDSKDILIYHDGDLYYETFPLETSLCVADCEYLLIAAFKHDLSFIDFTKTFVENIHPST